MRPGWLARDLASLAGASFTFIALQGFEHPKTRAHVRLLGPCFKTGRMDPYDHQHLKRMVLDHHPNDRQHSRSTVSSLPHSTTGRRDGTLALREACAATASVGPSREENRAVTDQATSPPEEGNAQTYLPGTFQTLSQPTLTRAQGKCDDRELRARDRSPLRFANPPAG